jgi:neuronal calcium sensor 1
LFASHIDTRNVKEIKKVQLFIYIEMGNCVGSKSKKDPKNLTEEEIHLLLQNTRLTRPQILALHQNFLKECPSGKLTQKDFVKLFKEVHPSENKKEKADKFCAYVFKVIDKENHGFISFQDFVLCFALTSDGDFREKCEFAFKLYDLDKDGKISKKEMTQVLTALYDLSGIDNRKGDNSPEKKVNDIIKKINLTYQPPAPTATATADAAAAAPASAPATPAKDAKKDAKASKDAKKEKPAKEPKKEKPAKEAKPAKDAKANGKKAAEPKLPEYITKEQFIDACSSDEQLKKLFVDSIFANSASHKADMDAMINNASSSSSPPVTITTSTTVSGGGDNNTRNTKLFTATAPSLSITTPKIEMNATKLDRDAHEEPKSTTTTETHTDKDGTTTTTVTHTINETITKTVNSLNTQLESVVNDVNSTGLINVNVSNDETAKADVEVAHAEPVEIALDPIAEVVVAAATEASANADATAAASNEEKKDEQQAQI